MDFDQAAELLSSAARQDARENGQELSTNAQFEAAASGENNPPTDTPSIPEGEVAPTEGTTEEDSFLRGLDPNKLPEEVLPFYKSMQANFTQAKQALAEQRRQFEAIGVDPSQAAEAVRFVQALTSDPDIQRQLYSELSQQFSDSETSEYNEYGNDEWDERGVDPEVERLRSELDDMRQWRQGFEQQQQMAALEAEVNRQEAVLRQTHPDLSDADMEYVYNIAIGRSVGLEDAFQVFDGLRNETISRYMQQKASVPSGTPSSTGPAQQPQKFNSLDEAHEAALEMLRNQLSQG